MLELEKEYTYKEICKEFGWEIYSGGNSKKAQIKEIESSFEFYHPINKKTHKEKKSYVFTKQLKEIGEIKHGGVRNTKAIQPMMDFLHMMIDKNVLDCDYEYRSITTWLCDEFLLFNKEVYNKPYQRDELIEIFCKRHKIKNKRLFCDYISGTKTIMKRLYIKSLEAMQKLEEIEFTDGFMFTYQLGEISLGHFNTDTLNEIIKRNETMICDEMNEKYHLSKKMKGRQLLMMIYSNEKFTNEYDDLRCERLMEDKEALEEMNRCIDCLGSEIGEYMGMKHIDENHPLLSYYRGIAIESVETDVTYPEGCEITLSNAVRVKARKDILNTHYEIKRTGKVIYPYDNFESVQDVAKMEKLLFNFYDDTLVDDTAFDLVVLEDDTELNELFGGEIWGEPEPSMITA